ncbi:MAG: response regulator transcription factor [Candidatus Riflebacteria bacterium]|nr:response regulator transcription factor [Candidatus Riflebacteria bacterium]
MSTSILSAIFPIRGTTVLLGVTDPIRREGVYRLLQTHGVKVLAKLSAPLELVSVATDLMPQVALLDFSENPGAWLAAVRQLQRTSAGTAVLGMIEPDRFCVLPSLLRAGVRGCLSSQPRECCLLSGICHVAAGDFFLSQCLVRLLMPMLREADSMLEGLPMEAHLTSRERQILGHLELGNHMKAIARSLGVSPKTVYVHQTHILRKLGLSTSRELLGNRRRNGGRGGTVPPKPRS